MVGRAARVACIAVIGGTICSCSGGETDRAQSPDVTDAIDVNGDPAIVEVMLAAAPSEVSLLAGTRAAVWTYRDRSASQSFGSIPGPIIRAKQGDRIVVHFRNELPEATTVHWHGVRVPPRFDGTLATQQPVEPGAEFTYDFVAEDAGTFWYHPHVRGDVQVERGLYGMLVVEGGANIPVDMDRAFVLDDVKLEATGQLSTQTDSLDVMLGRQGNVLLVNGRSQAVLSVNAGARERWRVVNAANGRYFNLRLPGNSFLVVGWDGGLVPAPYSADTLLIAPGERYEVIVEPKEMSGTPLVLETIHYDRGHEIPDPGPRTLMRVSFQAAATSGAATSPLPATWGTAPDLVAPSGALERSVILGEEDRPGQDPMFMINGAAFPDVPAVTAVSGEVETWAVRNDSEMDHPFHLHGMFFRVLDVGGVAPAHEGWKDTVNVPRKQTLRFVVRYGAAGTWMYHCHILEHAERGMMAELIVSNQQ